jgi:predicted metal-dependent hydrolase
MQVIIEMEEYQSLKAGVDKKQAKERQELVQKLADSDRKLDRAKYLLRQVQEKLEKHSIYFDINGFELKLKGSGLEKLNT